MLSETKRSRKTKWHIKDSKRRKSVRDESEAGNVAANATSKGVALKALNSILMARRNRKGLK